MSASEFVLRCASRPVTLTFSGEIFAASADDPVAYDVRLCGGAVEASVHAYDLRTHRWTAFFRELARSWRGWSGNREMGSLEDNVFLVCASDRAGHVTIRVRLRGDYGASDWLAEDTIVVEAGQLDRIAARAAQYFGEPTAD